MNQKAIAAVAEAKKHIGFPDSWARWRNPSIQAFDYSGFVQYCYKKVGINLPWTTNDQVNCGTAVSQGNLKVGHLVFPHAGYIGLYVWNGRMIHAPPNGDVVKISTITHFYTARRVA